MQTATAVAVPDASHQTVGVEIRNIDSGRMVIRKGGKDRYVMLAATVPLPRP